MKFSDRQGFTSSSPLQLDTISPALKTALWNVFHSFHEELFHAKAEARDASRYNDAIKIIYSEELRWERDLVNYHTSHDDINTKIKKWFFSSDTAWFRIYNLLEFLFKHGDFFVGNTKKDFHVKLCNRYLEEENSGYRFIADNFVPITNPTELAEVDSALKHEDKLKPISAHIKSAVELLSKKPTPDYRNSIKESISAVEAAAKLISKKEKGGLDDAFNALKEHFVIHGALRAGFLSIYGWTSDASGIRHALMDEENVGFDEAKFMLVACSAFANYLVSRANEAKML